MLRRILIVGDTGVGKTTLAKRLARKLRLPLYSTDDFFWKFKFTVPVNKNRSIQRARNLSARKTWVVEGTTRHLIQPCLRRADLILYLPANSLLSQYATTFHRYRTRKNETLLDLLKLWKHLFYKKYRLRYETNKVPLSQLLLPYPKKVVELRGPAQIQGFLKMIKPKKTPKSLPGKKR